LNADRAPQLKATVRHLRVMKHLSSTLLIALTLFFSSIAYGQEDIRSGKIVEFLKSNWEVRTETNEWQFTGKFIPLSPQLENDLLRSFPKHRFSLAEMRFVGHIPGSNYPLIVITDAESGDVMGFVRHLNWGFASKSFTHLFSNYHADTKEDLERRVLVLGTLIASTDQRGNVGIVQRKKNILSVELVWGGGIWRRLEAHFDPSLRIRRMALVNGSNRRSFF
jgi:hypothetical protein